MNILSLEKEMWQAVKDGNSADFLKLACADNNYFWRNQNEFIRI